MFSCGRLLRNYYGRHRHHWIDSARSSLEKPCFLRALFSYRCCLFFARIRTSKLVSLWITPLNLSIIWIAGNVGNKLPRALARGIGVDDGALAQCIGSAKTVRLFCVFHDLKVVATYFRTSDLLTRSAVIPTTRCERSIIPLLCRSRCGKMPPPVDGRGLAEGFAKRIASKVNLLLRIVVALPPAAEPQSLFWVVH